MARTPNAGNGLGVPRAPGPVPQPGRTQAVDLIAQALAMLAQPQPSAAQSHLDGLKNLPSEFSRIDQLRFEGVIPSGATPTVAQPGTLRIPSDYDAQVWGIQGYIQDPDADEEDFSLVTVKLQELGRGRDLFSSDLNMSQLVDRGGSKGILELVPGQGVYVIEAGKSITCEFTVNSKTNITAYNTTSGKIYGVCLWVNLKRPE